jgi:hypothetical protein
MPGYSKPFGDQRLAHMQALEYTTRCLQDPGMIKDLKYFPKPFEEKEHA